MIGYEWMKPSDDPEEKYYICRSRKCITLFVVPQVWGKLIYWCWITDNSTYRWNWHTRRMITEKWMKPWSYPNEMYYISGGDSTLSLPQMKFFFFYPTSMRKAEYLVLNHRQLGLLMRLIYSSDDHLQMDEAVRWTRQKVLDLRER